MTIGRTITLFAQQFDNSTNIKLKLDELTKLNNSLIAENFTTLETENKISDKLITKYSITNIDDIQNNYNSFDDFSNSNLNESS